VHHVGILYGQFMMHGQRNITLWYHWVFTWDKTTGAWIWLLAPIQFLGNNTCKFTTISH